MSRKAVALPTMSRTVSALVERGWLIRSEDTHDRRRVVISLTDEGHAYFESLHAPLQFDNCLKSSYTKAVFDRLVGREGRRARERCHD